jgi:hypothetical protein
MTKRPRRGRQLKKVQLFSLEVKAPNSSRSPSNLMAHAITHVSQLTERFTKELGPLHEYFDDINRLCN